MFGPAKKAADFIKDAEQQYGADAKTFLTILSCEQ